MIKNNDQKREKIPIKGSSLKYLLNISNRLYDCIHYVSVESVRERGRERTREKERGWLWLKTNFEREIFVGLFSLQLLIY